ncbi:hypothetical protein M9458_051028 [Cirrhinus mrigala]|uniref:Reverse transcriptase n=1 Tax=Cirrhinus mrigala TaxID=683832 RepID=A0ABD0N006_CIRMR
MSLEAAVPNLHAGGSGYWSPDVDLGDNNVSRHTLNDQAAFFMDSAACSTWRGWEKNTRKKNGPTPTVTTTGLNVACWNIRTMLDTAGSGRPEQRSALIAHELRRLNIDIAALSEVRLPDEGSLQELGVGYILYWSGRPASERKLSGVAFMVKTSIASKMENLPTGHSDRIISMRLPLRRQQHVTFLSVYSPTLLAEPAEKDKFYTDLRNLLQRTPADDKVIILGDFNARVGRDSEAWQGVLGKHGVGSCNDNGRLLLEFCAEQQLSITNTIFQQKHSRKTTWMHPRSKHWHLIDYVLVRQNDRSDVLHTRVMPSAECHTDHCLVRCKLRLHFKPKPKKYAGAPKKKLDIASLQCDAVKANFQADLQCRLEDKIDPTDSSPETLWDQLKTAIGKSSIAVLGFVSKRNKDWFDENNEEIQALLSRKRVAHQAHLAQPSCPLKKSAFRLICSRLQRKLREIQNEWWNRLAQRTQLCADNGDYKGFYEALKAGYGPRHMNEGEKSDCSNYRGITLLSIAGKILTRLLLNRLVPAIAEDHLPESQCGFRANRSTTDMVFVLRQLQEKCREQNRGLYITFVDLTKAFDTVSRQGMWQILERLGCPPKFLNMIIQFHEDQKGQVRLNTDLSVPFPILNGVKQGCVLAPTLFTIFFSMMLKQALQDFDDDDAVYIRYRLDGSLFNLRRLQAHTKTLDQLIRELLFADDAALLAHTERALQRITSCFTDAAQLFGLEVSLKKTVVLHQPAQKEDHHPPHITIGEIELKSVHQFTYLGCIITSDAKIDELDNRLAKANSAFGRLYKQRCLRTILGIHWSDYVTNVEVLEQAETVSIEALLLRTQLRWAGHVSRMEDYRLPKIILYGELATGHRDREAPKKRYKDCLKKSLNACHIDHRQWSSIATDRATWSSTIPRAATFFEESHRTSLKDKLLRKKNSDAATQNQTFPCTHCGRACLSRIGLHSHERACKKLHLWRETLSCSSDSNPPALNYSWFKGKTFVGSGRIYSISKISSDHSGEYKSISEHGGKYSAVLSNVIYPPRNVSVSINESAEIAEGDSVTLICSSDSNPPALNFSWFKENQSSAVGSGQSFSALQSGRFYCEAHNQHGSQRSVAVTVTVHHGAGKNVIVITAASGGGFIIIIIIIIIIWFIM